MAESRFSVADKVALITGGSRGIGRALALGFADAGADVAVASRTLADLESVVRDVEALGRRGLATAADVAAEGDVQRMLDQVLETFGRVDVLVNNAGISPAFTRTLKLSPADWRRTVDVNLTGTFLVSQAVGQHMVAAESGSVISVASIGARVGLPRLAAYCAAKAGIEALTRVLALEWAEHGVRVNAIGPAFVATDMTAGLRDNAYLRQMLLDQTPLDYFATPDDMVGAALFLASDAARYITGQTIFLDGGWLAR
jgi:NAD(P)-dependent dehydrogenase (short-subunit alcohol dehydrogenase family)